MKLLLFLAADYANITGDGKLNVMGIFNNINAARFPARQPTMHLIARLGAELGEYGQKRDFKIMLLDEDGQQVMDVAGELQIPEGSHGRKPEVHIILELKDVILPKPGIYQFVILVDKDHKGDLSLYVNQVEDQKPARK